MYWSDRQKQLYTQLEKDEKELTQRLTSYYRLEFGKLDKEIAAFYQKYGVNNIIEYRTVMEALPDSDRKLLIEQMEEFAKKYPEHAHLIPVRKNIYKLNRLEGLQQSVIMHQLNMGAVTKETLEKHLNKQALRAVNAAAEAMGFGRNFYIVSDDIVKKFVGLPWCNGKDFSERIWDNTNKLAYYLTTDISQGFARGDSYQKLTQQLKTRFTSVSTKDAYRLVYTEGTYVMAEGSMQPFTEDFEKYKISTAADGKVCSICSALARKEFYIKDRAAGVNFPPFHPWCRCTFEIVVDDWDEWIENYVNKHSADKSQAEKVLNNVCGDGIMSPSGFDIPKEWVYKGETSIIDDLRLTNPHFSENKIYQVNCQKCVPTYEMRRRGYDVEALPTISTADIIKNKWYQVFENAEVISVNKNPKETIIKALQEYGDNSRVQIYVKNKDGTAHTFIGENYNGSVCFIDPQRGKDASRIFNDEYIYLEQTMYFRIDDLKPTELIKRCCKARKNNDYFK